MKGKTGLNIDDLLKLNALVSSANGGRESANANFTAVSCFIGFPAAKRLATLTHSGVLRIPANRNKRITDLIGAEAEMELRSEGFRFVFSRFMDNRRNFFEIEFPSIPAAERDALRLDRIQMILILESLAESISADFGKGKKLHVTSEMIAHDLGVSVEYANRLRVIAHSLRKYFFAEL